MNDVKVSIVVAIYNSEKYLRQCVDSLIHQSLNEIEIILVSDKSPDNSMDIMKEYHTKYPKKIKIFETEENVRAGGARNLGLKMSSGEYFAYVDGDDYVDEKMYEKLYVAAKHESADCASCLVTTFDDETGKRKKCNYGGGFCNIVRKQFLIENNIKFPEKKMYEDNYFWTLARSLVNKEIVINENLYFARQQNTSVRHTITKRTINDRLDVEEMLIKEFEVRCIDVDKKFYIDIMKRYCLGTYYLFAISKKPDYCLIDDYVKRSNIFIKNIEKKGVLESNIYNYYGGFNKCLIYCLQKKPKIAYFMTLFCATVLKRARVIKRKVERVILTRK